MRFTITCLCLTLVISCAYGGPLSQILTNYFDNDGQGNYEFGYRTSDNIFRWQKGVIKYINDNPVLSVTGGFAFLDEVKNVLKVTNFKADENGYQPEESEGPGAIPSRVLSGSG